VPRAGRRLGRRRVGRRLGHRWGRRRGRSPQGSTLGRARSAEARLVKVRVGLGLGTRTLANDQVSYAAVVDALEDLRFDSLWLSERINGDAPDPVVAMAFAAGRTQRLKFGTSVMVLPGRNPVLL